MCLGETEWHNYHNYHEDVSSLKEEANDESSVTPTIHIHYINLIFFILSHDYYEHNVIFFPSLIFCFC